MKNKLKDWLKEGLIGLGIAAIAFLALFGPQIIRLHQPDIKTAAAVYTGPGLVIDKPSIVKAGQAAHQEPVEIEPVMAENVQATSVETGISVPDYIVEITEKVGQSYSISPELLQAIAWRESRFQADAVNAAGTCFGLMQISKKWHGHRLDEGEDILDPEANVRIAAEYLIELFERYTEPTVVLAIYNGDCRALEEGYVSGYAKDVLELAETLEK